MNGNYMKYSLNKEEGIKFEKLDSNLKNSPQGGGLLNTVSGAFKAVSSSVIAPTPRLTDEEWFSKDLVTMFDNKTWATQTTFTFNKHGTYQKRYEQIITEIRSYVTFTKSSFSALIRSLKDKDEKLKECYAKKEGECAGLGEVNAKLNEDLREKDQRLEQCMGLEEKEGLLKDLKEKDEKFGKLQKKQLDQQSELFKLTNDLPSGLDELQKNTTQLDRTERIKSIKQERCNKLIESYKERFPSQDPTPDEKDKFIYDLRRMGFQTDVIKQCFVNFIKERGQSTLVAAEAEAAATPLPEVDSERSGGRRRSRSQRAHRLRKSSRVQSRGKRW
jgi:hypothetical protein